MVASLSKKIDGYEDCEKVSGMLEQESKDVTASVFGEMLRSLAKEELTATSCVCPEVAPEGKVPHFYKNLLPEMIPTFKAYVDEQTRGEVQWPLWQIGMTML